MIGRSMGRGSRVEGSDVRTRYCVVPRDLAEKLTGPLVSHFALDPEIEVIRERRGAERRSGVERRRAEIRRRDEGLALADQHSAHADYLHSPLVTQEAVRFLLHDHRARDVRVLGSWDDWQAPGISAEALEPGLWQASLDPPQSGRYAYKFLLDGTLWLPDPANPKRAYDGFGGFNSVFTVSHEPPRKAHTFSQTLGF
jgi:hypothetical protein